LPPPRFPTTAKVPFINHQAVPAPRLRGLPHVLPAGRKRSPLSVLPPPRPRGARWIFHLPFVPASHSWRPASLNISPFALFIVGLKLGSRARARESLSLRRRSSFTHVHRATIALVAATIGLALSSSSRARAHAPACTHTHTHTHTHAYTSPVYVSRESLLLAPRFSERAAISFHLKSTVSSHDLLRADQSAHRIRV